MSQEKMNMNKYGLLLIALLLLASPSFADYEHTFNPPEPVYKQVDFMLIPGIPEMNLDFALAWTDSAAGFFLAPYDATILHVDIDGVIHDIFVFSDVGMGRLCIWMCTTPDVNRKRLPERITAYYGEDCGGLKAPSGITTNARNRMFDPDNDLIYLADRGNDRILELSYKPDKLGGQVRLNRIIGEGKLEWPVDVALASYGTGDPAYTDIFVVQWGHQDDEGALVRFNLNGDYKGSWQEIPMPPDQNLIFAHRKPASIECFPDTAEGVENIYVSDASESRIFYYKATKDTDPIRENIVDLIVRTDFWQSGGVFCDDYGRIYICNFASGYIESWEPDLQYAYSPLSVPEGSQDSLEYPASIVLDTYYGECEALVIEKYWRQTGIKTIIIDGGSSLSKPVLGFEGGNLVAPKREIATSLPLSYKLNHAYPNPFNSECKISFQIPVETHVNLEVFNILGQKVATLIDETKKAGSYTANFDASKLSSGTYFYTLRTDSYSNTKSVILIK
jgi:hypothetical protein